MLVAGGASTRMGFPKLWTDVLDRPLIAHAIDAARAAEPAELVLVVAAERLSHARLLAPDACVVPGGVRRRDDRPSGASQRCCQRKGCRAIGLKNENRSTTDHVGT